MKKIDEIYAAQCGHYERHRSEREMWNFSRAVTAVVEQMMKGMDIERNAFGEVLAITTLSLSFYLNLSFWFLIFFANSTQTRLNPQALDLIQCLSINRWHIVYYSLI